MIFKEIQDMADELNLTVPQFCKAANVQWRTVKLWRKRDPKTVEIIRKLTDTHKALK